MASGSGAPTAEASISPPSSNASPEPSEQAQRPRTCLQSGIVRPKTFRDGTIRYDKYSSTGEPSDLNEALADPKWKRAMEEEYNALIKNKTWHLVPARKDMNIIDCRWVSRSKGQLMAQLIDIKGD
jgi:histone deacetylase 1/2